jgi:transposase-like protein
MNWIHRFGSLSEAFYVGKAKVAVVDERTVIIKGEEAWIWIALEPKSRRLLALELSRTRNSFAAYLFLKKLKSLYGIRVIVAKRMEPPCRLMLRAGAKAEAYP